MRRNCLASKLVSDASKKRIAVVTRTQDLKEFLLEMAQRGQQVEHLYDY